MHYFLVTKSKLSYEQIDIMALFSNLRRNRVSRHFHNAVLGRGSTNKELAVQLMDLFEGEGKGRW